MPRRFSFKLLLAAWIALEGILLAIVVSEIGWLGAILLGLASTAFGFGLLQQAGADVFAMFRMTFQEENMRETRLADHTLKGIGALCLVLPGFCSDLIGLALSAPSIRQHVIKIWARSGGGKANVDPGVIDLDPKDWKSS